MPFFFTVFITFYDFEICKQSSLNFIIIIAIALFFLILYKYCKINAIEKLVFEIFVKLEYANNQPQ